MKNVPIAEFKAHCSRYVEEVSNEEIVITKHGKAVARLLPPEEGDIWTFYDSLEGKYSASEDVLSTGLKWDAES